MVSMTQHLSGENLINRACRRGLDYSIFEITFKFLTMEECHAIFMRVCQQWKKLYFKMFCSYSSLKMVDNSAFNEREMKIIFEKGRNLAHIRLLKDVIRRDFKSQIKFFHSKILIQAKVTDGLFNEDGSRTNSKRLLQSFKIKTRTINSQHNFISDQSLFKLCSKSCKSLEDVCLRNGAFLSNEVILNSLVQLKQLQRLDLSYCRQIQDFVIISTVIELTNLKNLSLRFLTLLTGEAFRAIMKNLKSLQGLDISGCFGIDLSALSVLRSNRTLKSLILEYLQVKSDQLKHLTHSQITTISLFCNYFITDR